MIYKLPNLEGQAASSIASAHVNWIWQYKRSLAYVSDTFGNKSAHPHAEDSLTFPIS